MLQGQQDYFQEILDNHLIRPPPSRKLEVVLYCVLYTCLFLMEQIQRKQASTAVTTTILGSGTSNPEK